MSDPTEAGPTERPARRVSRRLVIVLVVGGVLLLGAGTFVPAAGV